MPKKKRETISSVKGMHDILPEDAPYWEKVRRVVFDVADFYGFGYLETPILEPSELFTLSSGETSDIVTKQMYSFRTAGGDSLTLRPEGTAPVARAYLEHGFASLPQPVKVFYFGPMFRHESPQAGRFREHYQFGFEMLGIDEALADAEVVQIAFAVLKDLGLKNLVAQVNTIGDAEDRGEYRKVLKDYFRPHLKKMCEDCKERYKTNPLRMLDCKEESCQEFIMHSPQTIDYVGEESKEHFKQFLEFLDESQIPYLLNPYLVRGLDYYTRTVFEIISEDPEADKVTLVAGGRYDGLVELLGGKPAPAVGFGAGVERIIAEMKRLKVRLGGRPASRVFLVQLGELAKKKGLALLEEFRKADIPVVEALGRHSIRSQMKIADKLGVKLALILGQKEALAGELIIRDMTSGAQETVPMAKAMNEIKKRLRS